MDQTRLQEILARLRDVRLLVLGDFLLEQNWTVKSSSGSREERSAEAGPRVFDIERQEYRPGGAGRAAERLVSLGLARVRVLGLVGRDGQGLQLIRSLEGLGVDSAAIIQTTQRLTDTSSRLFEVDPRTGVEAEAQRFDIANSSPTPPSLGEAVLLHLVNLLDEVDGVLVSDRVREAGHGVVTKRVREEVASLAVVRPDKIFVADAPSRIGSFHNLNLWTEESAARRLPANRDRALEEILQHLHERSGRSVVVNCAERGLYSYDGERIVHSPLPFSNASSGAGTALLEESGAALTAAALCTGATLHEGAQLTVLAAAAAERTSSEPGWESLLIELSRGDLAAS